MHVPRGADNCIDRTSLNAFRAADANGFVNDRNHWMSRHHTESRIDILGWPLQQARERTRRSTTAGWALIDVGIALCERGCVGFASGESAAAALRLREHGIDRIDQTFACDLRTRAFQVV